MPVLTMDITPIVIQKRDISNHIGDFLLLPDDYLEAIDDITIVIAPQKWGNVRIFLFLVDDLIWTSAFQSFEVALAVGKVKTDYYISKAA